MGDTSEAALPPRCPCGFWGSSKTLNLCSKCFADVQRKQPGDDCTPTPIQGSPSRRSQNQVSSPREAPCPRGPASCSSFTWGSPLDTTQNLLCSPSKRPREAGLGSESGQSPGKRPRAGAAEEEAPTQKNRRRCFLCQNRLELVQQELGGCRCGFIFCMRHRLPEQHNCRFDHLGHGRQDAVLKMVKLERKVGRACQRIGEGCS